MQPNEEVMQNRRIVVKRAGGPDALQMINEAVPEPAPGQVRIKILAAGVAWADVGVRLGTYGGYDITSGNITPGYDIVGIVDKVGPEVSTLAKGQTVAALTVVGGYTDYLCWAAADLVPVPEGIDPAEGVSLVLNYMTAYQMLHRLAEVAPGEWILIHGGAGGVGTALLQLGKLADLCMIATASARKQAILTELGAIAVNYEAEDFVARIRQVIPEGVNSVYDPIGGENIARSFDALRTGGILVTYGNYIANRGGEIHPEVAAQTGQIREGIQKRVATAQADGRRLAGYFIGTYKAQHPDWFRTDLQKLFDLLAEHKIAPVVAERIPLAEAQRAHELLDRAAIVGKIVLVP
jgi:NADPH2:quinone reductase